VIIAGSTLLREAKTTAAPVAGEAASKTPVGPDNFEIAPTVIPWKNYKNEHYEKRGYKVADKSWTVSISLPF
jgi:hypothetical protein